MTIAFTVAGPPRGKGRPRGTKTGHFYTDARTRSYEAVLRFAAQQAMAGRPPLAGAVNLALRVVFPIPPSWPKKRQSAALSGELRPTTKPDADNIVKLTDALNGVVWVDDAQVVGLALEKHYGAAPGTQFTVSEVAP